MRSTNRIVRKNTQCVTSFSIKATEARPNTQYGFTPPFLCRAKQGAERAGFTLLELTLVAVIILALVTISAPLFKRTYEDLRLTSSVKEIACVMQFCRERAVFERRNFRLNVNPDKKTYQVLAEDEDKGKLLPLRSRWGRVFRIPDSIDVEADKDTVDFFPNGTTTPILLYLTNKEGQVFTILIEQDIGLVRVYDYKKIPRSLSSE